jgi:uncharacterized RDD family membrane protein YckC
MDDLKIMKDSAAPLYVISSQYSGFWRRFAAYIVDGILMMLIYAVIVIPLSALSMFYLNDLLIIFYYIAILFTALMIYLLYDTIFICSQSMATPGKRLLGIKVTDINGNRLSFLRALLRSIFKMGILFTRVVPYIGIISYIFWINPFLIVLTERKQALHDFVAGTVVVKNSALTEAK